MLMIKNSVMSSLIEVFENVEKRIKKIKDPGARLKFIDDTIDWIETLLDLLKKLKQEIEEGG